MWEFWKQEKYHLAYYSLHLLNFHVSTTASFLLVLEFATQTFLQKNGSAPFEFHTGSYHKLFLLHFLFITFYSCCYHFHELSTDGHLSILLNYWCSPPINWQNHWHGYVLAGFSTCQSPFMTEHLPAGEVFFVTSYLQGQP